MIDCIVFGFENRKLKVLLFNDSQELSIKNWRLIGDYFEAHESFEDAAKRILKTKLSLENIYLEPLQLFSVPNFKKLDNIITMTFIVPIDVNQQFDIFSKNQETRWFALSSLPEKMIFYQKKIVFLAHQQMKWNSILNPILFRLLPYRFTLPQLQNVYEEAFERKFDDRNFYRKLLSTGVLVKLNEKDKNSKRGAFYYMLNVENHKMMFNSFLDVFNSNNNIIKPSKTNDFYEEL